MEHLDAPVGGVDPLQLENRRTAVAAPERMGPQEPEPDPRATSRSSRLRLRVTQVGSPYCRIHSDFGGCAVGDHGAGVENRDRVADLHQEVHVVLDEQYRHAVTGQVDEQFPEGRALRIVQPGARLVQKQDARLRR